MIKQNKPEDFVPILVILFVSLLILGIVSIFVFVAEGNNMSTEGVLLKQLRMEEGYRDMPYRDSLNNLTIGYGWNIGSRNLSREEHIRLFPGKPYPLSVKQMADIWRVTPLKQADAEYLLETSVLIAEGDARELFEEHWTNIPSQKKVPILDMLFNLGLPKFKKFKRCIAAIKKNDFKEAGKQVRNSLAYVQAKSRYERIAKELEKDDKTTTQISGTRTG